MHTDLRGSSASASFGWVTQGKWLGPSFGFFACERETRMVLTSPVAALRVG